MCGRVRRCGEVCGDAGRCGVDEFLRSILLLPLLPLLVVVVVVVVVLVLAPSRGC